ncbi:MAG: hypothetical protein HQL37_07755 [Alphaproteobacteria bacterium]|nr:hypothetical protein [Alphaproteobacteria bacterium]
MLAAAGLHPDEPAAPIKHGTLGNNLPPLDFPDVNTPRLAATSTSRRRVSPVVLYISTLDSKITDLC